MISGLCYGDAAEPDLYTSIKLSGENKMISSNTIPVNATPAELVERVVGELRRSGVVIVLAKSRPIDASLTRAAETMDFWPPPYFDHPGVGAISLAVTGRRATVLRASRKSGGK